MKRATGFIVLLIGLVLLSGCGHPFIPASALKLSPQSVSPKPVASSSLSPNAGNPTAPEVGVDLYAAWDYPLSLVQVDGARDLTYIRQTLRADGVGIMWNLCSPSDQSTSISSCAGTLSPAAVGVLAAQAQHDGLAIEMRPVIRVGPASGWNHPRRSWEGFINPGNQRAFFASLLDAEKPYLLVARRYHAQAFVAASELRGLQASPLWPGFLRQAQTICDCVASYDLSDVLPSGAGGLDAYPHIQLPDNVSQTQLDQAWMDFLGEFPRSALRQASIQEISIPAEVNAYRHPANWNSGSAVDAAVQARWFTAACRAAARYSMRGIWFYEVNLTDDPAAPSSFPAFFEGRPASEAAIRSCAG